MDKELVGWSQQEDYSQLIYIQLETGMSKVCPGYDAF